MDGILEIIRQLEQQRSAIERALEALREVGGSRNAKPTSPAVVSGTKKRRLSPAGRRRIAEAARKRWAAVKAAKKA